MEWKTDKTLVQLADTEIIDIDTDETYYSGCETCDYGSEYVQDITFVSANGGRCTLEFTQMYDYAISTERLTRALLANLDNFKTMTWDEFKEFMQHVKDGDTEDANKFFNLIEN